MTCSGTSIKKEKSYKVLASYNDMYVAGNNMFKINNLLLISNRVYFCRSYIHSRKHTILSSCSVAGLVVGCSFGGLWDFCLSVF